jgi:hypothetical protein
VRVDRNTARRYVEAAQAEGLVREAGADAVTDELVGAVAEAVRPARPNGHGVSWEVLLAHEEQIRGWVSGGEVDGQKQHPLSIVKIEELLARRGVRVPYRTLHRFAVERCGFHVQTTTVRVADGDPGVECQVDFARPGSGCCSTGDREEPGGACADHRRAVSAHVRVVDPLPDPDRGDHGL